MRIGYFGSPGISARLLEAILSEGRHEVVFVVSNPDKPKGRSGTAQPTAVAAIAESKNIPLKRYPTLKEPAVVDELMIFRADVYVVFAYGKIIPKTVFELPRAGTLNLHASLLPLLRGASPIQSALLHGFTETGWTVQFINEALDAGDIVSTQNLSMDPDENYEELADRMVPVGIDLMLRTLSQLDVLGRQRLAQDHAKATHCGKITPEMALIDWQKSAADLHNLIRAFAPRPGARTQYQGGLMKILRTKLVGEQDAAVENQLKGDPPGAFVAKDSRIFARTGRGVLEITALQPENRRVMSAADFINGYRPGPQGRFT